MAETGETDTSGTAMRRFYEMAARRGLMPPNTARMLVSAVGAVLGDLDDWQSLDLRSIDQEDAIRRFEALRAAEYKPESLQTYAQRFRQAIRLFLEQTDDPARWRYVGRPRRRVSAVSPKPLGDAEQTSAEAGRSAPPLIEYPFPLREGRLAFVRLPADLTMAEVRRLTAYLTTLAIDGEEG